MMEKLRISMGWEGGVWYFPLPLSVFFPFPLPLPIPPPQRQWLPWTTASGRLSSLTSTESHRNVPAFNRIGVPAFNRITPQCTSLQQNHTKLYCQANWGGPFQSRIVDEVELNCWASASLECWRIALELLPTPNNWRWMRAGNWYFIQTSSNTRQLSSS